MDGKYNTKEFIQETYGVPWLSHWMIFRSLRTARLFVVVSEYLNDGGTEALSIMWMLEWEKLRWKTV